MLLNTITHLSHAPYSSTSKSTQLSNHNNTTYISNTNFINSVSNSNFKWYNINKRKEQDKRICNRARRRVIYEEDEDEDEDEDGYNEEISILEMYSQSVRGEALLVTAILDDQEVEVLIFKGFSSCLSYQTSSDPSKSVLPRRAIIKSIDRIKGPFNPSNIDYIEKGLTLESFKTRFFSTS